MSDDEDVIYVKKQNTVHYGSLEEQERKRLAANKDVDDDQEKYTNVHTSNVYMEIDDEMAKDKQALLQEFERRKKARHVNVSTDDNQVKLNLRQLGEPICLFGEGPAERRSRLRDLLSRYIVTRRFHDEDVIYVKKQNTVHYGSLEEQERKRLAANKDVDDDQEKYTNVHTSNVYMEIDDEMAKDKQALLQEFERRKKARHVNVSTDDNQFFDSAEYSLAKAKERLAKAKEHLHIPEATRTARNQELQKHLTSLSIYCSQVGDTRPISYCSFSPDSQHVATASWSGLCKLWTVPECELVQTFRGHDCNVGAIEFHPLPSEGAVCSLASCAQDGSVKLWSLDKDTPLANLEGHEPFRVSRIKFHPSGRFLGTCCWDHSWRLWDLNQGQEVLHQEGHGKPVYCMSFQGDGSVVATGGLDAFGRVWDLRTGRCIMFLEGHLKSVFSVDFSPDGYHLATGSEDNAVKIWDLRKRRLVYTIPAHMNLVSQCR
ncbi:U4/U6 small nuclear ribonucleoprotein Prp4-like [Diaphorina citri]|uniref:U4/U6 small nuclear ribonucleoprotein Prp4-like n=1 Tax=Diaphorina citri TaxID=121845 RepID=A0A3Q0IXZ0_DIACI|nr:U4/U6 small nuclear ribonucleoprotein Prp4-like [Diaphorina citri]